jgi:hypothetical protein
MKLQPFELFSENLVGAAPVLNPRPEPQHRPAPAATKPAGTKKPQAGNHGLNAGTPVAPTAGGLRQAMRQDQHGDMNEGHTITARELSKRLQSILNVNRQQADRMASILLS